MSWLTSAARAMISCPVASRLKNCEGHATKWPGAELKCRHADFQSHGAVSSESISFPLSHLRSRSGRRSSPWIPPMLPVTWRAKRYSGGGESGVSRPVP